MDTSGINKTWVVLIILLKIFGTVDAVVYPKCLHRPSFVSKYVTLTANGGKSSEAKVDHGLNEIPIKVDVQAKSLRGGAQFVFPGLGSSQRDDNEDSPYGGVVYRYDDKSVYLYAPNVNDGFPTGAVIYTGENTSWSGPTYMNEKSAQVRVRAWRTTDFPRPDYDSPLFPIQAQLGASSYKNIRHSFGRDPGYVIVQIRQRGTNFTSEGIGSSMHTLNVDKHSHWGGVIYGYNRYGFSIWAPGYSGYLFNAADGWGNSANETVLIGDVKIRAWLDLRGNTVADNNIRIGYTSLPPNFHGYLSQDSGIISVTVQDKSSATSNMWMFFPAMGAVQNSNIGQSFGGVVFSYSTSAVRFWYPDTSSCGNSYSIYMDKFWANGTSPRQSKHSWLYIKAWNAYDICPVTTTTTTTSTSSTTSTTSTTTHNVGPGFTSTTITTTGAQTTTYFPTKLTTTLRRKATTRRPTATKRRTTTTSIYTTRAAIKTSTGSLTHVPLQGVSSSYGNDTSHNGRDAYAESYRALPAGVAAVVGLAAALAGTGCCFAFGFVIFRKYKQKKKKRIDPKEEGLGMDDTEYAQDDNVSSIGNSETGLRPRSNRAIPYSPSEITIERSLR